MKKFLHYSAIFLFAMILLCSCTHHPKSNTDSIPEARTPVTVTSVLVESLEDFVELNATSTFLQQDFVKSNLTGYIQKATIHYGDQVHEGEVLFILKTKEAKAIGNLVNSLDSNFKFSGTTTIRAGTSGYVDQVNVHAGDYVQDGEQLAIINNEKSFTFVMNVPYDYRQFVTIGKQVQLILPDDEKFSATIRSSLPFVDSSSQTQQFFLNVHSPRQIPANLVARVKISRVSKSAAQTLDKKAVLSDEALNTFWVMKMINDSMAIKVPVNIGLETDGKVEIISPLFSSDDRILLTGNYGLGDTALVRVTKN
jgi:biotin carboxyl carrier protein